MVLDEGKGGEGYREIRSLNAIWRSVLHLGRRMEWPEGHEIRPGHELYFLAQGRVRLTQPGLDGQEKTLWYICDGCIFGETPFFTCLPPEAYFVCASDCVIYAFPEKSLEAVWKFRPDLMFNLTKSMAHKMRLLAYHATSMCLDSCLVRVCKFLAQRIVPGSEPPTVCIGMSCQEMANLLGINRISLYRVLRQQEEMGILGPMENRRVVILQPEIFFQIISR